MSILVIDVGTSGVRAAVVDRGARIATVHHRPVLPSTPAPGFVEFDPVAMADAVLGTARDALAGGGSVEAVGIATQRASTVVWDRQSGAPVGPGVGWQDLRTAAMCLSLKERGIAVAPNESATKAAFLLDMADPDRTRDLCFGTVDSWVAWTLSEGTAHVTDLSNAGLTGLLELDGSGWAGPPREALRIPETALPELVDSAGVVAEARALPGSPPIAGIAGDQQASLIGQGCTRPGLAKVTFGTGGMLDVCVGPERPAFPRRGPHGTFPIVGWRRGGRITWGLEAVMLTAGQSVEWLRDDLGLLSSAAESAEVAAACDSADGVWFVPALLGLGAPVWDFGARGTLLGLTRGSGRPQVVRAVLEGVAHRGVDLLEAVEADGDVTIGSLRVDGGMTANPVFLQALADAAQRPVEVSPVMEATTLGAAFLAGLAVGTWADEEEVAATWSPSQVLEPRPRTGAARERWQEACQRARGWVPELTAIEFA
ncbi:MAG TPA: FGGY family carbohydrate kinase [Acidimicrobiales bacterium]|nr:FGGY family carbohydrate kinase [Acidimicrobiales bacterium]